MRSSVTVRGRVAVVFVTAGLGLATANAANAADLRTPESFAAIADRTQRSQALFVEAGKVIQHPRCMNCHPVGDRPTQGDDMHPHSPLVVRGADDKGAVGMRCTTCHQSANFDPSGVPGHPLWHVAPKSMAWQTKSLAQICAQIKDRGRNGGKTLAQLEEHMAHDSLVGWGWQPREARASRRPAPSSSSVRSSPPGWRAARPARSDGPLTAPG